MKNKSICSNCASWNNKQAELHYTSSRGFCTSKRLEFNTAKLENCSVFDRWFDTKLTDDFHDMQDMVENIEQADDITK